MKLRLAFVTPRFLETGAAGGAETLLKHLAHRAAAAGHTVEILTTCARDHFTWQNTEPPGTRLLDDLTVRFFPVNEDRDLETFIRIQTSISQGSPVPREEEEAWIRNSVNSRDLMQHLRASIDDYDLLLAGPYLFGVTWSVATAHPDKTLLVPCLHDEPFAYLEIFHDMLRQARGCLFNARAEQTLAEALCAFPPERGRIVGMSIDTFNADPNAFARRHNIQRPYLLYSGRRESMKGTPMLTDYVDTFCRRTGRDLMLVMTGSGPIEAPDSLLPHLLDVGFVSETEKHEAMAGALAFCHPSRNESFGIVLLEAWLAGRPALVSSGGAVLVEHCRACGGGLWFSNYPEFEAELLLLMDQPDLAATMAQQGKAYVQSVYSQRAIDRRFADALAAFAPAHQAAARAALVEQKETAP